MHSASPFVIVSSPGMHALAAEVRAKLATLGLDIRHHEVEYVTFANGEVLARIPETVRRQHVFFFHPLLSPDPNTALMQMLIANDALRRASVSSISLVVPFMSYLRQDRKDKPRVPITARLVADLIETNKAVAHLATLDMHADQEQGFFSIPVDNLGGMPLFAEHMKTLLGERLKDAVVVAPDFGGAVRARRFAAKLGELPVAICEKQRTAANVSRFMSLTGASVEGKIAIVYDDMIDTGGTIIDVAKTLKGTYGARDVYVAATHGLFSGPALARFAEAGIPVLVTDSIPRDASFLEAHKHWLSIVPIGSLLAHMVYEQTLAAGSVSKLTW